MAHSMGVGCSLCPRKCGIDRSINKGFCRVGRMPVVAKACLHMWEEPCISGSRGSGTVFFSGCNMRCIFCQNSVISQEKFGREITIEDLGRIFLSLQQNGAHNINLVNPTHFISAVRECLHDLDRLEIPVVYNSSGYESVEGLKLLEGKVQVYLPDIKYFKDSSAVEFSSAAGYFEIASEAVREMYRQVGGAEFDDEGIIKKGLVVRHLILPGHADESVRILEWIKKNLPGDIVVSLMSQYIPYYKSESHPVLGRRITRREHEKVMDRFIKLDFEYGYMQERESAETDFIPSFDLAGVESRQD